MSSIGSGSLPPSVNYSTSNQDAANSNVGSASNALAMAQQALAAAQMDEPNQADYEEDQTTTNADGTTTTVKVPDTAAFGAAHGAWQSRINGLESNVSTAENNLRTAEGRVSGAVSQDNMVNQAKVDAANNAVTQAQQSEAAAQKDSVSNDTTAIQAQAKTKLATGASTPAPAASAPPTSDPGGDVTPLQGNGVSWTDSSDSVSGSDEGGVPATSGAGGA